jgi:hypothetical protein
VNQTARGAQAAGCWIPWTEPRAIRAITRRGG